MSLPDSSTGREEEEPTLRAVDSTADLPPPDLRGATRWAEAHGASRLLDEPLSLATPLIDDYVSRVYAQSLRARALRSAFEPGVDAAMRSADRVPGERLRAAARSYLAYAVGRSARVDARRELWAQPLSPEMAPTAGRVRALLEVLPSEEPPEPLPDEGVEFRVEPERLAFSIEFPHPHGFGRETASIHLVEHVEGRARTSLDEGATGRRWVRLAAERLLDALHDDSNPMHADLRRALARPRWHRLLSQLEQTVKEPPLERAFDADERLVWRVGEHDGGLSLHPALQKRTSRGGWSSGRRLDVPVLLHRLPTLDPRDARVVQTLRGMYRVGQSTGAALDALVGHPRVVLASAPKKAMAVRRVSLEVRFEDRSGAFWLAFRLGRQVLEPSELLALLQPPGHVARIDRRSPELQVATVPPSVRALAEAWAKHGTGLPADAEDALLGILRRLPPSIGIELPERLRGDARSADTTPVLRFEPLPGGAVRVEIRVEPLTGAGTHAPGEGPVHVVGADEASGARVHAVRNLAEERANVERTMALVGLDRATPDGRHALRVDGPEETLDLLAALRDHPDAARAEWPADSTPWEVVGVATTGRLKVRTKKISDFFAVRGEAVFDEGKVRLQEVLRALREGRRYVRLSSGRFAALEDKLREQLEPLADVAFQEGGELAVGGAAAGLLSTQLADLDFEPDPDFVALRERLESSATRPLAVPAGLEAELRPYQTDGVLWLLRLAAWADGGVLADDMGLGKTLQALALLLARADDGPALVVGPTSLADNWRRETARFAPSLHTSLYRGPRRAAQLAKLGPGDVLIASYDVMTRDEEALAELRFATVVFDEAQALKNPDTQRAKAARRLDAGFRVALTGTPLENHLGELHSLFRVVVPGYLGPWSHFRERFAVPIERDRDHERREALRGLLAPFLLRRTKGQVAPDLPPRTDVVRTIELSGDERAVYEAERRAIVTQLQQAGKDPKKRFAVLAGLTRMRRLACHPALVDPESKVPSSKLAELLSLVRDLQAEGHRSLVFSQFTGHLALVRAALDERSIPYLYLDGSTPAAERQTLVDRWQDGSAPLFLISLKAGGTGLNLTAADTVIHLDPWWNPAVEDQASDRTHRIGQDKPVTVVRLVSQGTIEEAVLELHAEKRELADALLSGTESNARLSADDLLRLLNG